MAEPSRPARLWYQSFVHPIEQAPYIERLQALLDAAASPGIRFEVHGLDPPDHLFHPLTEFRCAAQTIRNALDAERAGYDAFVIGHFQEPGLLEIRGAVDIPRDWSRRSDTACGIEHGASTWSRDHRSGLHRLA
jgi:allantoin racemase